MAAEAAGFVIPKRVKEKTLLEAHGLSTRDGKEIESKVAEALRKPQFKDCMVVHGAFTVNNGRLKTDFLAWKKKYREEGVDVTESTAFLWTESPREVKDICSEGLRVKRTALVSIGDPSMGVYVCKNPDYVSPDHWVPGTEGFFVIFKLIKGRVRMVLPDERGDTFLEPTPNHECHVARASIQNLFESSLIYVYEFNEENDNVQRPRQCYPIAVLHCTVTPNASSASVRPHLQLNSSDERRKGQTSYAKESVLWRGELYNKSSYIGRIKLLGFDKFQSSLLGTSVSVKKRLPYKDKRIQTALVDSLFQPPYGTETEDERHLVLLKVTAEEDFQGRYEKLVDLLEQDSEVAVLINLPFDGKLFLLATWLLVRDKSLSWESEICAVLSEKIQRAAPAPDPTPQSAALSKDGKFAKLTDLFFRPSRPEPSKLPPRAPRRVPIRRPVALTETLQETRKRPRSLPLDDQVAERRPKPPLQRPKPPPPPPRPTGRLQGEKSLLGAKELATVASMEAVVDQPTARPGIAVSINEQRDPRAAAYQSRKKQLASEKVTAWLHSRQNGSEEAVGHLPDLPVLEQLTSTTTRSQSPLVNEEEKRVDVHPDLRKIVEAHKAVAKKKFDGIVSEFRERYVRAMAGWSEESVNPTANLTFEDISPANSPGPSGVNSQYGPTLSAVSYEQERDGSR